MHKFNKMLEKKRDMSPSEKHAKMSVLKDMKHDLAGHAADKLDGMKKVSVISNSPEGMQAGLNKAQDMMGSDPSPEASSMSMMADGGEVEGIMNGLQDQDEMHEANPGESPDDSMQQPMGHLGSGLDMSHEGDEDMDLEEINRRIQHLMMLQKKAEGKS